MSPLTAWGDPLIEQHVQGMLDQVVRSVTQQMGDDLQAIVLAGGFGRGEGGVLRRGDGTFHVVNDFDLELVYAEPWGALASKLKVHLRHRRALARLAEHLAQMLDMKQIDLSLRAAHSLAATTPRLADYDLRHGHQLLWGKQNPCNAMPAYKAEDIPAFEATWLLRNRGVGLVLARLYLDQPGALQVAHHENFYIELNKSALAMGDALWLLSGHYHVSYAQRKARFAELAGMGFPDFAALAACYDQAAEYKLRPVAQPYPGQAPAPLWQAMARLHVRCFLWLESQRLQQALPALAAWQAWSDAQPVLQAPRLWRRWLDRRLGASGDGPPSMARLRQDRSGSVACAMALLGARAGDAADAWQVLQRWSGADAPPDAAGRWQYLARGLLSALHPSGEVGRFLAQTRSAACAF